MSLCTCGQSCGPCPSHSPGASPTTRGNPAPPTSVPMSEWMEAQHELNELRARLARHEAAQCNWPDCGHDTNATGLQGCCKTNPAPPTSGEMVEVWNGYHNGEFIEPTLQPAAADESDG